MLDASPDIERPLTIGVAWNGSIALEPLFERARQCDYVAEILVAPSDKRAQELARTAAVAFDQVRILDGGDTGIYSAWNKLVAASKTRYLCFHGADDLIVPDDRVGQALRVSWADDPMVVFTAKLVAPDGTVLGSFHHDEAARRYSLGRCLSPLCPEVAYPVRALQRLGGLDESFRIAGDADLYFKVRKAVQRVDVPAVFVEMTDGGASASAKHALTVFRENRRIAKRHGQRVPWPRLVLAAAFLAGRRLLFRLGGERFAGRVTDAVRRLAGRAPRYSR